MEDVAYGKGSFELQGIYDSRGGVKAGRFMKSSDGGDMEDLPGICFRIFRV